MHVSDEYAKNHGFPRKIMHGNILCGYLSYFVGEIIPEKNVIIQTQSIKFKKPVFLNDELRFAAEVTEYSEAVNSYEIKYSFENQSMEQVAAGKLLVGVLK